MGGGFGFGSLLDVQMLGFYQAQHQATQKHFLAYVLQVSTPDGPYLIYRRYSQIASLASKLHFHPTVGLPPKYALQVFPLTEDQLKQRFEGLQALIADVFAHLSRQFEEGRHHDVNSSSGLDMQIFYDFVSFQRNNPPPSVKVLPEWAKPTVLHGIQRSGSMSGSMTSPAHGADLGGAVPNRRSSWQDIESVTDSDGVGMAESDSEDSESSNSNEDMSSVFRNEVLQAEGNLNALWNCVRTYVQATNAWWGAASAVADEYRRIGDMPLFKFAEPNGLVKAEATEGDDRPAKDDSEDVSSSEHHLRLSMTIDKMIASLQPEFEKQCEEEVLAPLEALTQHHLAEIKQSYWSRLPTATSASTTIPDSLFATTINAKRLAQERGELHKKLCSEVQDSITALMRIQNELLRAMQTVMSPMESLSEAVKPSQQNGGVILDDCTDEVDSGQRDYPDELPLPPMDGQVEKSSVDGDSNVAAAREEETGIVKFEDDRSSSGDEKGESGGFHDELQVEEEQSAVWVWGRPPSTESGTPLFLRPKKVSLLSGQAIVQVACGGEHILYLTESGDVYSYGDNEEKKFLTRGHHQDTFLSPHLVEEFALEKALHRTQIIKIACGAQHSVGITSGGELYTWGSGEDGRLGHGDMRDRSLPRKVMSLLKDRVVHASCGGAHTAVLTDKGTVFTFGRGRNGRLGLGDNKWRDTPHEITAFPQGTVISLITCGWNFTAALARDGAVYSWGKQGEGQCGLGYLDKDQLIPRRLEKLADVHVVDISCGYTHTVALTTRGDVYSWGLGEYGQLGRGIVYQPVPELVDFSEILCAPDKITNVYCGAFHSVVTTEKRVLFAWGLNVYGACGLGHIDNKDAPERIDCFSSDKDLVISCGHKYTVALEIDPAVRHRQHSLGLSPALSLSIVTNITGTLPISHYEASGAAAADPMSPHATAPWPLNSTVASPPPHGRGEFTPLSLLTSPGGAPRDMIHEKEEELRRAKKLWRTRILRNWEESKDTPLAHSMWRQGIPPSIRARVWPLAIANKLKITPEMYQIYRKRATAYKAEKARGANGIGREHTLSLIDTDLPRTFPSLKLFDASGPYYDFLLEVLETYACYRPDLGYIQGMSYLAAMLCLHMPQDRYLAFQCLANLMVHEHLFTFYLLDAELSDVYYALFDEFLLARLPELHAHLANLGISNSMYLMNWLQTLFLQVLPLELAARVFDNFLLDGTVFLFRTALAIHELLAPELLRADIDEALPILQKNQLFHELWRTRLSEDALFRTVAAVAIPSHIYAALDRVVNDVFFYDKRRGGTSPMVRGDRSTPAGGRGGQSVGIGRVQNERRRMYSISDTLNGVLGGF